MERKTLKVPIGYICKEAIVSKDGETVELILEPKENKPKVQTYDEKWIEKYFPLIHVSSIFEDDKFFKSYKPRSLKQQTFKERLFKSIEEGVEDFRAPILDPSVDANKKIYYKENSKPGAGKLKVKEWKRAAEEFFPEKNSCIGSPNQRIIFLALIIKELITECNYEIEDAWKAVCDESGRIAHYWDSEKTPQNSFETTGQRKVGKWYDLGNTSKLLYDSQTDTYFESGGNFSLISLYQPLAEVKKLKKGLLRYTGAWVVLSA